MNLGFKNHILYPCYELTKQHTHLHERIRQFVLEFEIPLFIKAFRDSLGQDLQMILPRHSLIEPHAYNVFMSDIDLTLVVTSEKDVKQAFETFYSLKKYYPNLGEPEVLTLEEWNNALSYERPGFEKIWSMLFQLRKLSWQTKKLSNAQGEYEVAKIQRGISNSLKKLSSHGPMLKLDDFFPECPVATSFCEIKLPCYSHYLERWIELIDHDQLPSLVFSSIDQAEGFIQLIPGHVTVDLIIQTHPLRRYLLAKEINLSQAQLRIQNFGGTGNEHIEKWVQRLRNELQDSLQSNEI